MPTTAKKATDLYLGADPGGGIAVIAPMGVIYTTMPETDEELWAWIHPLRTRGFIHATLERVWSWGGECASGAFTFGCGYGALRMALVVNCQTLDNPVPKKWQEGVGIVAAPRTKRPKTFKNKEEKNYYSRIGVQEKNAHKEALRAKAQKLYPHLELWNETLKRQRAICDAILLAHHCKLKHTGKLNVARKSVRLRNGKPSKA